MANESKQALGSPTTVISIATSVTDTYIVGGNTELDNSTVLAPAAVATLSIPDTFGAAPDGVIRLLMVRGDVDGTSDDTALGYAAIADAAAQTDPEYAEVVCAFPANVDEAYRCTRTFSLMGVKKAKFYIQNVTGTSLAYSASAITVKIVPLQIGT